MTFVDIYQEVMGLLDATDIASTGGLDIPPARDTVVSAINTARRWLAENAPLGMLAGSSDFVGTISNGTSSTDRTTFVLTSDFCRLLRAKGTDWHRALSECVDETSKEYLMQSDPTAKATADRPVAALVCGSTRNLELFPPTVGSVDYIKIPSDVNASSSNIDIPSKARNAFVYRVAALVALAWKDASYKEYFSMSEKAIE